MTAPTDAPERTTLPADLRDRVLARLGLDAPPAPDLAGLRAVYGAWCAHVPFDNVRKMIALRRGGAGELPGTHADDFLEAWLAHGCGGTCWPSSNALFALLRALGFPARRIAASMRDVGLRNHGSVKVALDGRDWLVDTSMQTGEPLPLGDALSGGGDPMLAVEVEPDAGTHVVWHSVPPHDFFPCRLLDDPVDHAFYAAAYEGSRGRSPFNASLYARRNLPGALVVLRGPTRYLRTAAGTERRGLARGELLAALRDEIGIAAALVDAWAASGALEDTFAPPSGPPPPPITNVPPSRRRG